MRRVVLAIGMAVAIGGPAASRQIGSPADPVSRAHRGVDPVIQSLWERYDGPAAIGHVEFMSRYWRLPGNAGYNASLDRIKARLAGHLTVTEDVSAPVRTWDHAAASVAIVTDGPPDEVVLSKARDRLTLAINSFSTPASGIVAPIVDVGRGDRDADYAGRAVKGAVVLGEAGLGALWQRAVVGQGALGVISSALPAYLGPDPPGAAATPRDTWDILQWGSVPYDEARRAFGFKASPRAAARLRAAARARQAVRVTIASTFEMAPVRTLIAEIPGRAAAAERIVMAAHAQEPGANDNASGVATLAELAVAMASAVRAGAVPPPGRTLTFLFLNEISGSRDWLRVHADQAARVKYMFSLDMTGEDVEKTGGSFLVERWPDPGAVWDRPWDPHSEWGRGDVKAESLKGDLLNDVHLMVCRRVAEKTGWVVKSHPYEGGSDHTVFGAAGIPSVLDWHFTDRYYHSNFDTADKASAAEMRNVGVAVGATAWLLASANEPVALDLAEIVALAGAARIREEETEGAKLAAADPDPVAAQARERTIVAAWRTWYADAVRSASRLVLGPTGPAFAARLEDLAATVAPPQPDGCLPDERIAMPIPLTREAVILAGDGRLFQPCPEGPHGDDHRERREADLLVRAMGASDPELRRLAARATGARADATGVGRVVAGRFEPGVLLAALADADPGVRREAANAIGLALAAVPGEHGGDATPNPAAIAAARLALEAQAARESDPVVAAGLFETIGTLKYGADPLRDEVEGALRAALDGAIAAGQTMRVLGIAKGLDALVRQAPRRPITDLTRQRLRRLAVFTAAAATAASDRDVEARVRRLALLALQAAGDSDEATLVAAARDPDWQVRRLAALRLDSSRPALAAAAEALAADPVFQVRYDRLAGIARQASTDKTCAPLARFFDDRSPIVAMRAMDLVAPGCNDQAAVVARLAAFASSLGQAGPAAGWHVPARALAALARLSPASAAAPLAAAERHAVWQVRAAASAAAATLGDEARLLRLAADGVPNVQTAAIEGLRRMRSPAVVGAAARALAGSDHELLRVAAGALAGAPEPDRVAAAAALFDALARLTRGGADNSRDARVAILERLAEIMAASDLDRVRPFLSDFDRGVRRAAAAIVAARTGAPAPAVPVRARYPFQPAAASLARLPREATIEMENGGAVVMDLRGDEAPVTVALFADLARSGYYDGLTFHRIAPNFVVQGLSPGANEYVGRPRFNRDELGTLPHVRGAVGISTRGRDTGDMQIFFNLVDSPRLDHDYTVFATVRSGMDVVDGMLEGARVRRVTVR
jgi:cyclophilin family peptidyl-prolyl cis-trans isomerase